MSTLTLVIQLPDIKLKPVQEYFHVITAQQFNDAVNSHFIDVKNQPFNFIDTFDGDYMEDDTVVRGITGVLAPMAEQRLNELADGQWALGDLALSVYLNELVRIGYLPAGDYIITLDKE